MLGLLVVVLIWGLNFPIIKVPLEVLPPFAVNALRFGISTLTLGLIWAVDARRSGIPFFQPMRERPVALLALGILGHATYQALFILGIVRTPAGTGALLIASSPLWTALIGHFSGLDRLNGRAAFALAVCAAGVAVVILGEAGGVAVGGSLAGSLLMLAGGVAWALYTVFSRPVLTSGVNPMGLTFFSVAAAAPLLLALGVPDLVAQDWSRVSPAAWGALAFSGILSTGVSYALWNEGVRKLGPARTGAFSNLTPFVALLASYVLLHETITLTQVFGGLLIVGGLILMRRK